MQLLMHFLNLHKISTLQIETEDVKDMRKIFVVKQQCIS